MHVLFFSCVCRWDTIQNLMVLIHPSQRHRQARQNGSVAPCFLLLLIIVFALILSCAPSLRPFGSIGELNYDGTILAPNETHSLLKDREEDDMRRWRLQLEASCQQFLQTIPSNTNLSRVHLDHKQQLESDALGRMVIPDRETALQHAVEQRDEFIFCSNVFIDLGTNRGDSISCAVDASLDICSLLFVEKDANLRPAYRMSLSFPRLHFNVSDLRIHASGSQGLSLLRFLQDYFIQTGMESVCVYGMEGNPYFTNKLKAMERVINAMRPRPLKHLHIQTETIVNAMDGPTTLFIDQYSEKNHFWGSSVLQSMPDIQRSKRRNNGTLVAANVSGISLSSLLKKTLKPFQPGLDPALQRDGSLLVKMDIEGAEFAVLKEIATSGVLCDYVKLGNNATLLMESHLHLIKDPNEKKTVLAGLKSAKETLRACGVRFRKLPDFWT